jgi:hypothetical protein
LDAQRPVLQIELLEKKNSGEKGQKTQREENRKEILNDLGHGTNSVLPAPLRLILIKFFLRFLCLFAAIPSFLATDSVDRPNRRRSLDLG